MDQGKRRFILLLSDESQEFQRLQAVDAQRIVRDLDFDVEVLFAANSPRLQHAQLAEILARGESLRPTAIFVQPVAGAETLETLARQSAAAGIAWTLLNRRAPYMNTLRLEHPQLPIATVSSDQREIGRLQARQLLLVLGAHSRRALCIQGLPDSSAARDRLEGMLSVLSSPAAEAAVQIEIADGDWTEASGEKAMAAWLKQRRSLFRRLLRRPTWMPDALVCQNDHMAVGARHAAKGAGLDLPVLGVDGLPEGGQRLVDAGDFKATVIVPPNAGVAIRLVARHLQNRQPLQADVLLPPISYPQLPALGARQTSSRLVH